MSKKAMVSQPMASDERLEIDSLNEDLSDTAARLSDALEYCDDMERDLARAMESAAAQVTVCERPPMALWWWLCALKYVWRMWSKEDPRRDGQKAIDCIRKALAEIGERG